jgi:hypothetical protein
LLSHEQAAQITDRVALQGMQKGRRFEVSEIITPPEPTFTAVNAEKPSTVPPAGTWRVFGQEERAHWDGERLRCRAGQALAGAFWQPPPGWSREGAPVLNLWARGTGEWSVAIADAEQMRREAPLELGRMALTSTPQQFDWPLPPRPATWQGLTFVCPSGAGELVLDAAVPRAESPIRSTWLWSPGLWLDQPNTVWQLQQAHGLKAIYVTVPVVGGAVRDPDALAAFISQARSRDLAVWAVIGDPGDVLPTQHQDLFDRLRAFARYNETSPATSRLAGVQMDIEPYLLPGYRLEPTRWRALYIDTVAKARQTLDASMPLDLVVPVWWGTHDAWGQAWLEALAPIEISLTVMNYRTHRDSLIAGAQPFLAWSEYARRRVAMALEYGPLPDEQRQYFERAPTGALLKLRLGEHHVLVLLKSPIKAHKEIAYKTSN